ncbi:MAG: TSUP family transporter, partial [Isosphaeraceae bacterium]
MDRTEIAMMLLVGGCAGVLSGMFGIGGGLIIVPVLIVMCDLDPKTAVGTSLFALLLPTGLLGVLEYWRRGELRFVPGLLI